MLRFITALLLLGTLACKVPKPSITGSSNMVVSQQPADTAWFNWLTIYSDSLHKTMNGIIGKTDTSWNIARPNSNLGNLITDCLIDYGNHYLHDSLKYALPEIALMNTGGIRTSLPSGNITLYNLFEVLPFENEMVLVKCRGSLLDSIVQYTALRGGEPFSKLTYSLHKLSEKNFSATHILCNNKPIKSDQYYWIVTNDYLANGGDGFFQFLNADKKIFTRIKIRDAVKKVLETESFYMGKIQPRNERRITLEN